jgi:CHAT domain-containing protein
MSVRILRLSLLPFLFAGVLVWGEAKAETSAQDFSLGQNTEHQVCRAVARFDAPKAAKAADIYCGAWERPSGRIDVFTDEGAARSALAALCAGDAKALQAADFLELRQVACGRTDKNPLTRYALVARRGASVAIGEVYPSDWGPLVNAARVLTGAVRATAVASADIAGTPGLREIQAVFPSGPPGQGAAFNFELLRRRAYEYNTMWEFGAAERDFEALLQAQERMAPDDLAGEAEIFAEIGLNMSSARRFDEASASFARAEALARSANNSLLASKIENYRAIDLLNRRHFAAALKQAQAANQSRVDLVRSGEANGSTITAGDVSRAEGASATLTQRTLLISFTQTNPAERAAILNAQGDYIAGVAERMLGSSAAAADYLNQAASFLEQTSSPPARLVADIANERANLSLASNANSDAANIAANGLAIVRTVAPGTRSEAHLWLTLEEAQNAQGQTAQALTSGRAAIAIYSKQTESPGLPPDVAAQHLALLEQQWRGSGDPALAAEYFQTLALVWDGAAARTTALLAARLALREAGSQARDYQDAERAYRAASARRQLLAGEADVTSTQLSEADTVVRKSAAELSVAEAQLRARAPAYLELLSPGVSAVDLQSVLGDGEAYLRIVMTSRGGFGVLTDKKGVVPFRIGLTDAQVDALADRLRRSTQLHGRRLPDYDIEAATALYDALLGPVQDRLAASHDLDLDVSGSLASIPFAALVASHPTKGQIAAIAADQDYSGIDWLARHFAVVDTLGPASFVRLRKEPPRAVAQLSAVAYGDFQPNASLVATRVATAENLSDACRVEMQRSLANMGPLPETADEAHAIAGEFANAKTVLGPDFTDDHFLHDPEAANADIVLLATHGVLALSPCFPEPALLTSVGEHGIGLIEASALLDLQLKARLVVLSACDTAAGAKLDASRTGLDDGGDALSGLARAIIYAGAREVLASEWKVDSDASKQEIAALLTGVAHPGENVRQALSQAQDALYRQAETGHPFYWAPFILIGDGGDGASALAMAGGGAP